MAALIGIDPTFLISGVSALLKAIDTWVKYRDSERAAAEFEARRDSATSDPAILDEASVLATIVPPDVLDELTRRTAHCWARYLSVLKGNFLPAEVDEATKAVKECICREVRRIADLNAGKVPDGQLRTWSDNYKCQT